MNDWRSLLRDADPGRDAVMPAGDVRRVRSVVLSAASDRPRPRPMAWPRAFVVSATLLLMVCASVLASLQRATQHMSEATSLELSRSSEVVATEAEEVMDVERQQLHFRTPGGTRIIWVFDSQFEAKGTLP